MRPILLFLAASSAFAADPYTCVKAKTLKTPAPVAYLPAIATVDPYQIGVPTECEIGKLAQVCMPSNVEALNAVESAIAQCCFKVKCEIDFAESLGMGINEIAGALAGTFSQSVDTKKKASMVCVPCDYMP